MEQNLYRLVNGLLLTAICLLGCENILGQEATGVAPLAVASFVTVFLAVWCQVKIKGRLILLFSGTACAAAVLWTLQPQGGTASEWMAVVGNNVPAMQAAGIALCCFLGNLLLERFFWLKAAAALGLLAASFVDLFTQREFSHFGVVCILMYVVIVYIEWTQRVWKKQKTGRRPGYVIWIMPFLLLYLALMLAAPAPEEPYNWQFVKDAYSALREGFLTISQNWLGGHREDFDMGASGFSGEGRLLGGLSEERKEVMVIRGQKSLKTNVYLIGKVYDTFQGREWAQISESTRDDRTLDALETLYAVRMYEEGGEENYVHLTRLEICYQYFHTEFLFAPLKTVTVSGEDREHTSEGGNLLFGKNQGYGTSYQTSFLQINVDHPLFYEFVEGAGEEGGLAEDEQIFRKLQKEYIGDPDQKYSLEDLEEHRQEIHKRYGQEPALSKETQEWLSKVTEDADTDMEKLKAIEEALRGFSYNRTPGRLPEKVHSEGDFLDYFLLENPQGFCTYFATAFVLLARAEGIPARYVEGFCIPVEGDQSTVVYSDMAHAWPEVYIDGRGWIPFEPTPGYDKIRYTPWEMQEKRSRGEREAAVTEEEDEPERQEKTEADVPKEEPKEEFGERVEKGNGLKIAVCTGILVAAVCMGIFLADAALGKRRYRKRSLEEKFYVQVGQNMRMLAFLGYDRRENETLEELQKRAWAIMEEEDTEEKPRFLFLQFYEEVLYGGHPVEEDMLKTVLLEKEYLLRLLKKWKPLCYFYCRFVMLEGISYL